MKLCALVFMIGALADAALGQAASDRQLAQMLSDGRTREAAVASVVAAGAAKVPLLLSWTQIPPAGIERTELYFGLAQAFGAIRAKEAIPFLVQHISIQSLVSSPDVWTKTIETVEDRLPAVKALIRIGPDGAAAVAHAAWEHMGYEDRLASLIVISRVGGGTEAREFILRALGEANLQRDWAEEALKVVSERSQH